MKIIWEKNIDLADIAAACELGFSRPAPSVRDPHKWHVTSLIDAVHRIVEEVDANLYVDYHDIPEGERSIMDMGRIWETAMDNYLYHAAPQLGGQYVCDLALGEEDIIASLDGLISLPDVLGIPNLMPSETKLRFSLTDDIPLKHLQQIKAYCHLTGITLACYPTGHMWSDPPMAMARMRILEFEQGEIDSNWQGILDTREYLVSHGWTPEGKR